MSSKTFVPLFAIVMVGIPGIAAMATAQNAPGDRNVRSLEQLRSAAIEDILGFAVGTKTRMFLGDHKEPIWEFSIEDGEIKVGETALARITVKNPDKRVSYFFSPPGRAFLAGTVEVWVRKTGQDEGFVPVNLLRNFRGRGIPALLAPGESKTWLVGLNDSALIYPKDASASPRVTEFSYLGTIALREPGEYEIVLRYLDVRESRSWSGLDINKKIPALYETTVEFAPIVLGPQKLTVKAQTQQKAINASKLALEVWRNAYHSPLSVVDVKPYDALRELKQEDIESLGDLGHNIRIWQLCQKWKNLAKKKGDVSADWEEFNKEVYRAGALTKRGTPVRAAHEMLLSGCYVQRGLFANALELMRETDSPDVSTYLALQLLRQLPRDGKKGEQK